MYENRKMKKTIVDAELRDLFAGMAMQGMLSSDEVGEMLDTDSEPHRNRAFHLVAKMSYEISDAMVNRRKLNKDMIRDSRGNLED